MKNKKHILIAAALIVCLVTRCSTGEPKTRRAVTPSVTENSAEKGKVLFEEKCVMCHGEDGKAGISNAADLQASELDTLSVIRIITHGKNAMPAFSEQLGTGEIDRISDYVFTLRK